MKDRWRWLDDDLRAGKPPDAARLRAAVTDERKLPFGFDSGRCAIAAALLDDRDLWTTVVTEDFQRDYAGYRAQKDSGATEDDLGRFPSLDVSRERIQGSTRYFLRDAEPALAKTILDRVSTWERPAH